MLSLRENLLLFFALAPDEMLTRGDMATRWGTHPDNVLKCTLILQRDRFIEAKKIPRVTAKGPRTVNGYVAGPALLKIRGQDAL